MSAYMRAPRFGFVTCVQLGLDVMDEIYLSGGRLEVLITLVDDAAASKSGRVFLDEFAVEHEIPLVKIRHINDAGSIAAIREYELDWLFIIGWSQIASVEVLSAPTQGCIGMHPTLLPEGRGRASIPWAIIKALPATGVTMFQLDTGVDTGPILAQAHISLGHNTDATELYGKVARAHRQLIRENWDALVDGTISRIPQDRETGSVWPGRTPQDGLITQGMNVDTALRLVRATTHPYPGAFWEADQGIVRVWRARRASGVSNNPVFRCVDGLVEAMDYDIEASGRDAG